MVIPNFSDPTIAAVFIGFAVVVGLVAWLGGGPERLGVLTLIGMVLVQSALLSPVDRSEFFNVDWASVAADALGFAGFTAIMLFADRLWPIAAFSLQLISLLGHFIQGFAEVAGYSYVTFKTWPTMIVILLVLFGTIAARWRRSRHGDDRDWLPYAQWRQFRAIAKEANLK